MPVITTRFILFSAFEGNNRMWEEGGMSWRNFGRGFLFFLTCVIEIFLFKIQSLGLEALCGGMARDSGYLSVLL